MRYPITVTVITCYALSFTWIYAQSAKDSSAKDTKISSYEIMKGFVQNGKIAPDFRYLSSKGDTVQLSSFKGKYVVLDLWATWCGSCIRQFRHYEKLQEKLKNDNIVFISISIDDDKKKWMNFVKKKI